MSVSLSDEEKGSLTLNTNHNTMEHLVHGSDGNAVGIFFLLFNPSSDGIYNQLTYFESVGHLLGATMDHRDDPNLDTTAPAPDDESPYPEVRSAISNTDDPTMPSSTFRAWVVGLIWVVLISGVNQFFFFRYPTVFIAQVCICSSAFE